MESVFCWRNNLEQIRYLTGSQRSYCVAQKWRDIIDRRRERAEQPRSELAGEVILLTPEVQSE